MPDSELILNDREIIPMVSYRFGVSISEEESNRLLGDGYLVKAYREKKNKKDTYYLVVNVRSRERSTFRMAMLETAGRADVVISPYPWRLGNLTGTRAYVKSFTIRDDKGEIIALCT